VRTRLLIPAAAAVFGAVMACSQETSLEQRVSVEPRARTAPALEKIRRATFRLDVKMVQIPVVITDAHDHPVMGLGKNSFRIFEDDVEQEISAFSMADGAISAGLVFDSSGSMRAHIDQSREAIHQFLTTSVPGDEFFLVRFADQPKLVTPLTSMPDLISQELGSMRAQGWTSMNDALFLAAKEMRRATNSRHVMLVLSDGADNNSRYSDGELLSMMRETDAGLFAIGLFERPRILEKLADETGGRVIWVRKISELPEAMEKLSLEIRNHYVIGYFSDHARNDGKYHKVRVEVSAPPEVGPLRISWRRGYAAP
jgi:Ca-activated chloride channel family protein